MAKQHYMTEVERYKLEAYLEDKIGVSEIARRLGFSRQTIYNEIKRGTYIHTGKHKDYPIYSAMKGQDVYEKRQHNKGRPEKLKQGSSYMKFLEAKLIGLQPNGKIIKKKRYSPAAALASAVKAGYKEKICTVTLNNYIYRGHMGRAKAANLWESPYRRKYGTSKSRVVHPQFPSIEIRPEYINLRAEPGHVEMDLIISGKKGRSTLLTMTDRLTRKETIIKLPNKKADSVIAALQTVNGQIRSITTDNGVEFLAYEKMKQLVPEIYYCHSYAAWEKGTNENHNRMIRRWYPKGTNFDLVSEETLTDLMEWMNNYPRKSLGWMTPNEVTELVAGM